VVLLLLALLSLKVFAVYVVYIFIVAWVTTGIVPSFLAFLGVTLLVKFILEDTTSTFTKK